MLQDVIGGAFLLSKSKSARYVLSMLEHIGMMWGLFLFLTWQKSYCFVMLLTLSSTAVMSVLASGSVPLTISRLNQFGAFFSAVMVTGRLHYFWQLDTRILTILKFTQPLLQAIVNSFFLSSFWAACSCQALVTGAYILMTATICQSLPKSDISCEDLGMQLFLEILLAAMNLCIAWLCQHMVEHVSELVSQQRLSNSALLAVCDARIELSFELQLMTGVRALERLLGGEVKLGSSFLELVKSSDRQRLRNFLELHVSVLNSTSGQKMQELASRMNFVLMTPTGREVPVTALASTSIGLNKHLLAISSVSEMPVPETENTSPCSLGEIFHRSCSEVAAEEVRTRNRRDMRIAPVATLRSDSEEATDSATSSRSVKDQEKSADQNSGPRTDELSGKKPKSPSPSDAETKTEPGAKTEFTLDFSETTVARSCTRTAVLTKSKGVQTTFARSFSRGSERDFLDFTARVNAAVPKSPASSKSSASVRSLTITGSTGYADETCNVEEVIQRAHSQGYVATARPPLPPGDSTEMAQARADAWLAAERRKTRKLNSRNCNNPPLSARCIVEQLEETPKETIAFCLLQLTENINSCLSGCCPLHSRISAVAQQIPGFFARPCNFSSPPGDGTLWQCPSCMALQQFGEDDKALEEETSVCEICYYDVVPVLAS
eukprot:TRINITY_DN16862_c0_g2_i1.p1 TRINITY_DN16862_c0_g2~~TRINITY_DN16862_c0_g2_i1.p1  ORF type:complete len:725 (+),score=100.57 TRINITY_DN16862_c0_g2_i1:184-2175(+)